MDKSVLKAFVAEHLPRLADDFGLDRWTIKTGFDLREEDRGFRIVADCTRKYNYNQAYIRFDPDQFDEATPEETLKTIRHELFHVILAPFDLYSDITDDIAGDDRMKQNLLVTAWKHSVEQAVIALERMYECLTTKEACPTSAPQPPASAPAAIANAPSPTF